MAYMTRRETASNRGTFWAILDYAVKRGDTVLGKHMHSPAGSAAYTSSKVQNQLVNIIGDYIRDVILRRVKCARWYTVAVDDVTDISNKEQLCIVLQYVDPDTLLQQEDLIEFIECDTGITGLVLAAKILASLSRYSVGQNLMRGQCYDGASNMALTRKGAAAIITCQFKQTLYLHCA